MDKIIDVLIVGAGQSGAQVAMSLRRGGFDGSILIVGREPDAPYERPPLSKDYFSGKKVPNQLLLRQPDFWKNNQIDLVLGSSIVSINADKHIAETDSGELYNYGKLVWATGGEARRLNIPGSDLNGIHVIRTRHQVDALKSELESAQTVAVIGGGYVGLEAAAVMNKMGKDVTIIEVEKRVLARVAAEPISRFYEAEHRSQGVTILTGVGAREMKGHNGRVTSVVLDTGEHVAADIVIVGIGLVPSQQVLEAAGAKCANGVEVDAFCRTSLVNVFSSGDCACHPNKFFGGNMVRLESVPNAVDQAKTIASVILGVPEPYETLPWFWSNQYDLKLQTAGLNHGYDSTVLRGDPASRSFSLVYFREGQVIAIDAINSVKDFIGGKKLVDKGIRPDLERIADPTVLLKSLC